MRVACEKTWELERRIQRLEQHVEQPRTEPAAVAPNRLTYLTWAGSRLGAVAILFWLQWPAAGWFAAGFAVAEIGVWMARAKEQHWRAMAAKMSERVQELQAGENARAAAASKQRVAADLARMNAEFAPKLATRQPADRLVPATPRKDVH